MLCCAHAIFYFKLYDEKQDTFLIHENVYLIDADDIDHATQSAIRIAKGSEDLSEDGHLELNEKKAAYVFAGLRKVIEVESSPGPINASGLVGLELTYSEYEVDGLDQVFALARGEMVEVLYRE